MQFEEILLQAREHNENEEPKAALKILEPFYDKYAQESDYLFETAFAFELMREWEDARRMLMELLQRYPLNVEAWIRLSYTYLETKDTHSALNALNSGLTHLNDNVELISAKANLLAEHHEVDAMTTYIEEMIAQYPEVKKDLLLIRADIYEYLALSPSEQEEVIKDIIGTSYSKNSLELAYKDLSEAIDDNLQDWRLHVKRAKVLKQLKRYDEAIEDYDKALDGLDEEGEYLKNFLLEERNVCYNNGEGIKNSCTQLLQKNLIDVEEKEKITQEEYMANSLTKAMAMQCGNTSLVDLFDEIGDDPDELTALTIAQQILESAKTPYADFQKTDARRYEKSMQRFCLKAEKSFVKHAFETIGDYEPKGLIQQLGRRLFFRLFISKDRLTHGFAYRVEPLWPGWVAWLLLRFSGQWKVANVIELESQLADGRFLITNNTEDINAFVAGEHVDMQKFSLKTPHTEIFKAHYKRLNEYKGIGNKGLPFSNLDEIFAMQESLRVANNDYRKSSGYISDEELEKILGKEYDKFAPKVKKHLEKLTLQ